MTIHQDPLIMSMSQRYANKSTTGQRKNLLISTLLASEVNERGTQTATRICSKKAKSRRHFRRLEEEKKSKKGVRVISTIYKFYRTMSNNNNSKSLKG
jgi:hypothetical protein